MSEGEVEKGFVSVSDSLLEQAVEDEPRIQTKTKGIPAGLISHSLHRGEQITEHSVGCLIWISVILQNV